MKITLKAARVNRGLTQEELAVMMGVTPKTVMNWETGATSITVQNFAQLCDYLHVGMEDIILPTKTS